MTVSPPTAEPCDVLIIGGGPAGSTAAALLAERGRDVVLLEKDRHPRFHIGESLLPLNLGLLDRLGLRDRAEALGVRKPGAEFVSDDTGCSVSFDFTKGIDQRYTYSFQVPRADFDDLLFANAAEKGARTAQETRVVEFIPAPREDGRAQVTAVGPDGETRRFAPRFVLDASGRDTFMAGKLRLKESNKRNNTASVFAHFRGAERRSGDLTGYITVHLVEDGWFWIIPLPDGITSVGFVGNASVFKGRQGADMTAVLAERIRRSPTVAARMQHAELVGEVMATGNYSYKSRTGWGDGYMLIGDAFAFVDPVFSSGVLLAMATGERGAEVAATWLDDPAAARALARRCERNVRRMMRLLGWLIYRINTPELRWMFMSPSNRLRMREGLVSVLAGNLEFSPRYWLPVMAFKAVWYMLHGLRRLGWQPVMPSPQTPAALPATG